METERSALDIIGEEVDKIRVALADFPQLHARVFPCLDQIRMATESAFPCPILPAISLKEYVDHLPDADELQAIVVAAGERCEFHGYTFWRDGDGWTLTNPLGIDDVMKLRGPEDFERFLIQLRAGAVIGA